MATAPSSPIELLLMLVWREKNNKCSLKLALTRSFQANMLDLCRCAMLLRQTSDALLEGHKFTFVW